MEYFEGYTIITDNEKYDQPKLSYMANL